MLKQLRYFFTLMLLAVASVGWAADKINFADKGYENGQAIESVNGGDFSITFNKGTNNNAPKYYTTGSAIRCYGGNYFTVESDNEIAEIVLTFSSGEGSNAITTDVGNYNNGTWTGTSSSVTFTIGGTSGHRRIASIAVTYATGDTKQYANVTIGSTTINIDETTKVSTNGPALTLTTEDDDIVSIDGTTITGKAAGTATITATWTENEEFNGGSKTFTVTVKAPVQALENIAALSAQETNGEYDVNLSNAVVTYVNGNYAYIQDASGAIVMYKSGHGLTAGQVLNGTATVTFQLRSSNPQITALSGFEATDGTAPEPAEVAADAWNTPIASVLSQYFKVTGATITKEGNYYYVQLGDEKVQLYGQGDARNIQVPNFDVTYTIVGFPTLYNTTKELQIFVQPIPEEEVVVVPTPTFNPAAGAVEAGTTVTIELPEGAEGIEYSFDQQTWNEYTAPIEITEATTIYARAYDQDDNYSEVVSAKYTIKEEVPTQDVVIVEEDKTTFLFNTPGNEWGFPLQNTTEAAEFTANGKTIEVGGPEGYKYNTSDKYLIFGRTDAYITLPAFDFPVGKIEVVGREAASGNTKQNIFVGETAISTETTGAKGTNEYNIPANYQTAGTVYTLKVTNNYNSQVTQIIVYKADGTVVLADPELAFSDDVVATIIGEEFSAPELTFADGFDGTITYTSSNPNVAEVDAEGNVTLKAAGTTIITASSEATGKFEAGEASYTLTVEEAVPVDEGNCYVKVTSTDDLVDGTYIIVYGDEEIAFNGGLETLDAVNNYIDVTILGDKVEATNDVNAASFIIKSTEDGYSIKSASGLYIGNTSDANALKSGTTAYANAITIDEDGNAAIVSAGSYLRFNAASNQMRFRYYKSASYTGQKAIQLYRKVQVDELTVPVTIGSSEYATLYYGTVALEVPQGVTAKIVTGIDEATNEIVFEDLDGIIPAGTAVVLNGAPKDDPYEFKVVYANLAAPENNLLKGSNKAATTEGGDKYYKLTVKNGDVGFYWGAEEGGAFMNGAHKAYLAIPAEEANGVKFFAITKTNDDVVSEDGGFTDGINTIEQAENNAEVYNLNGVRVNTLRKGIYIVGGKKVVIK